MTLEQRFFFMSGAIPFAFGIGTSQVRDVLASQTLALSKLKVRKIEVNGTLQPGVYAKDVVLHIIQQWLFTTIDKRHQ